MEIHVHVHNAGMDCVSEQLAKITHTLESIMALLDDLTQRVEAVKTVNASVVMLLRGLKQKLDEAGTDQVKLKALADALGTETAGLADAVVENTPADPAAPTP